ncbi:MAG TPA: COX15/CtaA family protein [Rubricoccaceae bacterium]
MPDRFRRLAWGVLGYTVLVVLWGGLVRASGSGAGCGAHWPLCNGEVVPTAPGLNTVVEFTHRVMSGLALPAVLVLLWGTFRWTDPGHDGARGVRKAAVASVAFMLLEAALGAGLVLFEYVAYNPSIARAVWMAAHLVNTFLLLGALALVAWWASGKAVPRRVAPGRAVAVGAAVVATLVLGAGGAVTALGDTLVLGGGLDPASDPVVAALVGMRLYHPLLACLVLGLVAWAAYSTRGDARARPFGRGVLALFGVQMGIGLVNVQLLAPIPLQLVHLFVTDLIWIGLVLFAATALREQEPAAVPAG